VNSIVKQYLSKFFASTSRASTVTSPNETHTHYYKLPFVGPFSSIAQRRIRRLTQRFCKNLEIKLVFTPYKIKNLFSVKNAIPKTLRSRVVYKFGETNRHLEHLTSDKNSHIFQHIYRAETCKALCSEDCFSIPTQNQGGLAHRVGKTLVKQTSQSRQSISFILIVLVNFSFLIFFAFSTPLYFSYPYSFCYLVINILCALYLHHIGKRSYLHLKLKTDVDHPKHVFKLKTLCLYLKFISCLLLFRKFGNTIKQLFRCGELKYLNVITIDCLPNKITGAHQFDPSVYIKRQFGETFTASFLSKRHQLMD